MAKGLTAGLLPLSKQLVTLHTDVPIEFDLAAAGVRSYALQFEDDRNTLLLPGYASVQVYARQRLAATWGGTQPAFDSVGARERS